jgi:hypothetical protein
MLRADCAGEGCSCGHEKNAIRMLLPQKRRLTDEVLLLLKRAALSLVAEKLHDRHTLHVTCRQNDAERRTMRRMRLLTELKPWLVSGCGKCASCRSLKL